MFGNRTEGAATETTAHDVDRKTDHLPGRNLRIAIGRVRCTCEWQIKNRIHLRRRQWQRGRIQPDVAFAMPLNEWAGITRVGFQMEHARGMRIQHRIIHDLLIRWQSDRRMLTGLFMGGNLFRAQRRLRNAGHDAYRLTLSAGAGDFVAIFRCRGATLCHRIRIGMRLNPSGAVNLGGINDLPVVTR